METETSSSVEPLKSLHIPLEVLEEWNTLTSYQKAVLEIFYKEPTTSKYRIAEITGIPWRTVYQVFHSEAFKRINVSLAQKEKSILVLRAIRALEECLSSKNEKVRFDAAIRILEDADILRKKATGPRDSKILVVWGDKTKEIVPIIPEALPLETSNDPHDTIYPAS